MKTDLLQLDLMLGICSYMIAEYLILRIVMKRLIMHYYWLVTEKVRREFLIGW